MVQAQVCFAALFGGMQQAETEGDADAGSGKLATDTANSNLER